MSDSVAELELVRELMATGLSWQTATLIVELIVANVGAALPTSSAGLPAGTLWNNGGFVCVA